MPWFSGSVQVVHSLYIYLAVYIYNAKIKCYNYIYESQTILVLVSTAYERTDYIYTHTQVACSLSDSPPIHCMLSLDTSDNQH